MTWPGPPGGIWALALLLFALTAAVLGELLRGTLARWVSLWQTADPIERFLLDFFLGGALVYLIAALPFGFFVAPVAFGLPIAAALGLFLLAARAKRSEVRVAELGRSLSRLGRPAYLLALASFFSLYGLELTVALPAATGNTFDSGLLTTYTALLLNQHHLPLSFAPYATVSVLYPQGTTAWLGWAQLVYGLPPARTSLLVTPLFFALAPLAAFVFGRRWFGTERAGAALAVVFAVLAPATRDLVGGSNDFVFAFPLVLLLAAEARVGFHATSGKIADTLGFGLLLGYSAALNPVGAEWLLGCWLLTVVWGWGSGRTVLLAPLARWAAAALVAILGVVPSLYTLVLGRSSPGFVPGAAAPPSGSPTGITGAQFLGSIDPFLFRPQDAQLSTVPELRAELAVLLLVGLVVLLFVHRGSAVDRYLSAFRGFALRAGISLLGLLAVLWLASTGLPPAVAISEVTSAGEISIWLFVFYVLVAAVPLLLAFEWFVGWLRRGTEEPVAPRVPRSRSVRPGEFDAKRAIVPLALAVVIVAPGVALTPVSLSPTLAGLYHDFGNVTQDDFALLEYAGAHLPAGARVLIAPGSAADFLPGYASRLVLLYPLVPGFNWTNSSYNLLVSELSHATLDARGRAAMSALDIGYVIVTGNSTILWPAFSPVPLLADPSGFPLLWQSGDAYLFERAPP